VAGALDRAPPSPGELVSARIRRADQADAPALARLRRCWAEEDGATPVEPDFERRFATWFAGQRDNRVAFVAERDDAVIGMMHLAVFERMPRPGRQDSRWGYLSNAFVLAVHRDDGVGAALIEAVLGYAMERGCVRVVLSPTERAEPFYRRAGFGPATMLMARVLRP
jgi:GNAT superfamily N-acetyltransferase